MPALTAKNLGRSYGPVDVLLAVDLAIEEGERVGLVGKNGGGKSTLARILAGLDDPDTGEVVRRSNLRLAYLEQDPTFAPGLRAIDVVLSGLAGWYDAMQRYDASSAALSTADATPGADQNALLLAQAQAAHDVEAEGGWDKRHEAEAILGHLGLTDPNREVLTLSGGERRRVALARILVAEQDLVILDEPTNHLDMEAIEWLERWLLDRYRGALVLVTHDRRLLDRVTTRTLEVENGHVHSYDGGWGLYLEARAERAAHDERVEANRRNFLRRELEWLRRSPKARTTKQKARIDRVEAVAEKTAPKAEVRARLEIGDARAGRTILEAEHLFVGRGGPFLIQDLTLRLSVGERLGIVGRNGCGKSTLLRTLTGTLPPSKGEVRMGKNTRVGYLDQQRAELDPSATIYDSVAEGRAVVTLGGQELEIRSYLERFLFPVKEQRRTIGTLSGGERARVALARTLREAVNLVVLDEPTNDLDVMTLAALEEALLDFGGTLLVVTHDRWFLDRVATALLVFEGTSLVRYEGGYSDYLEHRPPPAELQARETARTAKTPARAPAATPSPTKPRFRQADRLELERLPERIAKAERELAELEQEASSPALYARAEPEQRAFFARLEQARQEAGRLTDRWIELESLREATGP